MRQLVVLDPSVGRRPNVHHTCSVEVRGRLRTFAVEDVPNPLFDGDADENAEQVLVRVHAFSLNYRDLSIIEAVDTLGSVAIGSEFSGEVVAIGRDVTSVSVGNLVIGDMSWPSNGHATVLGGVPTNRASVELQTFHYTKLTVMPAGMPIAVGAAFALGSQTAFSLARRLNVVANESVLVTAARSNTALLAIQRLVALGADVTAVTTSRSGCAKLNQMGVTRVVGIASQADFGPVREVVRSAGSFSAAVDPFADAYIQEVIPVLAFFGRYVTCGLSQPGAGPIANESYRALLAAIIVKNIRVIGNCLGMAEDLETALREWAAGRYHIPIDTVATGDGVREFIERTFCDADRFGKVVYVYR